LRGRGKEGTTGATTDGRGKFSCTVHQQGKKEKVYHPIFEGKKGREKKKSMQDGPDWDESERIHKEEIVRLTGRGKEEI